MEDLPGLLDEMEQTILLLTKQFETLKQHPLVRAALEANDASGGRPSSGDCPPPP